MALPRVCALVVKHAQKMPVVAIVLQAFLRPGMPLQPGMVAGLPPGAQLSLPDAVRLRDRATILARQLYAAPDGAGPAVADQQVRYTPGDGDVQRGGVEKKL